MPATMDGPTRRRPRRGALPLLLGVLVLVVVAGGWVVAAQHGAQAFDAAYGESPHAACDGDLTEQDVRVDGRVPTDLPAALDETAAAFDDLFGQDRWAIRNESEDLTGGPARPEIRFAVDGDVLERWDSEGFTGLVRPGSGIARFEGDRFWVPACVNTRVFDGAFVGARCIETERNGTITKVTWASVRDGSCEDAILRHSATLADGQVRSWTTELEGRYRDTWTVEEPRQLSWPSPVWIVPGWLA